MKAMITVLALGLTVGAGRSQTVYSLQPDTKGNQIELTVANTSATVLAERVSVRVAKHPAAISFRTSACEVRHLEAGTEGSAIFVFDVGRGVAIGKRDTLEFIIKDMSGATWTKSIVVNYSAPATFTLDQNFPNPFNPTTNIQYQLPLDSRVTLKVYDMLGREVVTLVNEEKSAGYFDVRWNAVNVASGVYFYRIEAQPVNGGHGFQQIKRLMVVK